MPKNICNLKKKKKIKYEIKKQKKYRINFPDFIAEINQTVRDDTNNSSHALLINIFFSCNSRTKKKNNVSCLIFP